MLLVQVGKEKQCSNPNNFALVIRISFNLSYTNMSRPQDSLVEKIRIMFVKKLRSLILKNNTVDVESFLKELKS